ncbi:MAG: hypothetical protein AAFN74_07005, partial [Myxococcota bacterium]
VKARFGAAEAATKAVKARFGAAEAATKAVKARFGAAEAATKYGPEPRSTDQTRSRSQKSSGEA